MQCFLILFMAIERYILVCYPAEVDTILAPKRRLRGYALITSLLVITPFFLVFAYRRYFLDIHWTDPDPFSFSGLWSVGNQLENFTDKMVPIQLLL